MRSTLARTDHALPRETARHRAADKSKWLHVITFEFDIDVVIGDDGEIEGRAADPLPARKRRSEGQTACLKRSDEVVQKVAAALLAAVLLQLLDELQKRLLLGFASSSAGVLGHRVFKHGCAFFDSF